MKTTKHIDAHVKAITFVLLSRGYLKGEIHIDSFDIDTGEMTCDVSFTLDRIEYQTKLTKGEMYLVIGYINKGKQ